MLIAPGRDRDSERRPKSDRDKTAGGYLYMAGPEFPLIVGCMGRRPASVLLVAHAIYDRRFTADGYDTCGYPKGVNHRGVSS